MAVGIVSRGVKIQYGDLGAYPFDLLIPSGDSIGVLISSASQGLFFCRQSPEPRSFGRTC